MRHRHRFWPYSLVAGLLALAWLVLRSGARPTRLAYPCQQAALSAAVAAFGATLVGGIVALKRRLTSRWLAPAGLVLGAVALIGAGAAWSLMTRTDAYSGPRPRLLADYRAQVFHETNCPQDPVGDRFLCVEDLIEKMGAQGVKLHRSTTESLTAGPDGILADDDVVVVKINYQWSQRGGTNTDLLRGLMRRIVDHPDGFSGEIVVCENTQFQSTGDFDRDYNNAQDLALSPRDVVDHFRGLGYRVSIFDLAAVRYLAVGEFSGGNLSSGYVVYDYDAALHGAVSYPKFTTEFGTRISLKYGIWQDKVGYDRARLKFINVPVLKSHGAVYGVTAAVKNYMGVVTRELGTSSHSAVHYGLMGALLGEIRMADLNILDAIWINANPNSGPSTSYSGATRTDQLVASRDPVAADIWAAKNVLIPAFIANGYSPPWPHPSADPDDPNGEFRQYLDNSMNYLLAAGFEVTNELARIDAVDFGPPGEAADPAGGGNVLTMDKVDGGYELGWSAPVRGDPVTEYELYRVSLNGMNGSSTPECETALGMADSAIVATLPDDHGFLVVARNLVGDGSGGRDSQGHDRPTPLTGDACP